MKTYYSNIGESDILERRRSITTQEIYKDVVKETMRSKDNYINLVCRPYKEFSASPQRF